MPQNPSLHSPSLPSVSPSLSSAADQFGLLPYQLAFAANPARFKIGLWARQTGKDHTCAFEAVADSLRHPGTLWLIVAAGERQALESLAKAREWAGQLQLAVDDCTEDRPGPQARIRSAEIRWANGSRLLALPANPQTIRGYSANIILTEFAFHENPDEIWRALYPSISNPLRGGPKKLRIISTPNGLRNKFAQLWHSGCAPVPGAAFGVPPNASSFHSAKLGSSLYHKSCVTIHDAVAAGLPLDPAELQAGLDDPDAWNQEYLCQFADTSSVLLPYDLIECCESPEATDSLGASDDPAHFAAAIARHGTANLYAGIDFGRKRHLTVCWLLQRVNNRLVTREVITLRNQPVPEQLRILRPRVRQCLRVAFDYTGAGIGLGDSLVQEFREYKPASGQHGRIELCQFTPALKGELFPRLQAAFERRDLLIPPSRDIREDLHGLHRCVSESGQIAYRAISSPDGHSDRATALVLALRAASHGPATVRPTIVGDGFVMDRDPCPDRILGQWMSFY